MNNEAILNYLCEFLLNEPSGDFHLTEDFHRLIRANGLSELDIKKIADMANSFDGTGKLAIIYLSHLCREQINDTIVPVSAVISDSAVLNKYRECLGIINSNEVKEYRAELVGLLAYTMGMLAKDKVIGESTDIDSALDKAIEAIFKEFPKLKFEVYANSGLSIEEVDSTVKSVQVCGSLAECLIRLEKSKDGIYICFIANPGTLDGWFGFFMKSNGNLFSYNERIDEVYAGQHSHMRNGRYVEDHKAYDLFPYDLCEFSEETDYKGYSTEFRIGENRSLFSNENLGLALRTFLSIALIMQKHKGHKISGEPVVVNSLLPMNLAQLEKEEVKSTALVSWQQSPIVSATANYPLPRFKDDKVISGEYDKEFDGTNTGDYGVFSGINQDIVDAYGEGFRVDYSKVLASNSSKRLIGNGHCEQEFIGSPKRMRLQAYYEVRKQLARYIYTRMMKEFNRFGGKEGLLKWYRERLEERRGEIYALCAAAYKQTDGKEGSIEFGSPEKQVNCCSEIFGCETPPMSILVGKSKYLHSISLSEFKEGKIICPITGEKASWSFTFCFETYKQVHEFLKCELPKFCTGWRIDKLYNGNSILDVTDPVGDMVHPMSEMHRPFNFAVDLSKRGLKKLMQGKGAKK